MSINIFLKDGSVKEFDDNATYMEVAGSISTSLAKKCLLTETNGILRDMSHTAEDGAKINFITTDEENEQSLDVVRHSTAHLLAYAIKELFPSAQIVIGPVIKDGFYYDVARDEPFSIAELDALENKMRELRARKDTVERIIMTREEAIKYFTSIGEIYKVKLIQDMPEDTVISEYKMGEFTDMCRGPHVPNTGVLEHFKLLKVSGSYWRGDSKNESLQRIYGTAWLKKSSLEGYLHMMEEMEKRDHRKIGKELDLFHQQAESPGDIFWHPKGYRIYLELQKYIRNKIADKYKEVKTPQVMRRNLWEASGHWEKYAENMFALKIEDDEFAIKPMNCPAHVQIFNEKLRSYRDLPIRLAEFGCCHRFEPSGALHGIMRTRAFVQDDAHIFCSKHKIKEETVEFVELLMQVYKDFGFEKIKIKFSDRPEKRAGSDAAWDASELALKEAIEATGYEYTLNKGEGAFYGPKLEFVLTDAIGRDWQCGTIQVDMVLPERLNATFINSEGQKEHPVMLHRAVLGSIERFLGILIENYSGKLPFWLAPLQVVVCSLSEDYSQKAQDVAKQLKIVGINTEVDTDNQTINYKIRHHSGQKVPYIVVIGKKEVETGNLSIRQLGIETTKNLTINQLIEELLSKIASKQY